MANKPETAEEYYTRVADGQLSNKESKVFADLGSLEERLKQGAPEYKTMDDSQKADLRQCWVDYYVAGKLATILGKQFGEEGIRAWAQEQGQEWAEKGINSFVYFHSSGGGAPFGLS